MKIDIYKSSTNNTKYVSVKSGQNPVINDADLKQKTLFKSNVEINAGESRIAFDSNAAIAAIENQNYYIHAAEVTFNSN